MDAFLSDGDIEMNTIELNNNEIREILGLEPIEEKEKSYSLWMDYGKDFVPAVNLQTKDKLPTGIYKIREDRDGIHFSPTEIKTDELYTFSENFTTTILKEVEDFWSRKDVYAANGIVHKRGLLLEGGPGCGKSCCISLLVNELIKQDGIVFIVNSIKDFDLLYDNLSGIFRKIEPERPVITILEDIDKLINNLQTDAPLLDLLDGKVSIDHHLVIMTSNDTSDLSPALLRPSRIDMRFVITSPTDQVRKEFFEKKGITPDKIDSFTEATEGMSFAQMKEVFIGTEVLGKDLDKVVEQILDPTSSKDYLVSTKKKIEF